MRDHAFLPAEGDIMMQREHLSRQQRIEMMQVMARRTCRGSNREDHARVSTTLVERVPPCTTAKPSPSLGKTHTARKRYPPKDLGGAVASPRRLTDEKRDKPLQRERKPRGENLAASHYRKASPRLTNEKRDKPMQRERKPRGENLAASHYRKVSMLKVWRHWSGVIQLVQVHTVKAERHHQYCILQGSWIRLMKNVACSRTNKKEKIESILNSQKIKKAWREWKNHQQALAKASYAVRRDLHVSMASRHLRNWIEAWTHRARRRVAFEQDASRRGQRAIKSRLFQSWKDSVEAEKRSLLLAEERFQTWQQVRHWLTPMHLGSNF